MTNPWGIAAVTETIGQLLRGIPAEDSTLGPLTVSAAPPDRARMGANADARQLNLFLYQVTPNPGWTNADLPFRSEDGVVVRQPALALDLRYLLTAYGLQNNDVDAHHVLAHAMSLLHDQAVLRRDAVRAALDAAGPPIRNADLDKQIELIKLTPDTLSDEELFRMWTVFGVQYRISVAYHASVVLLERRQRARRAPPVRTAQVTAVPLRVPIVETIDPQPAQAGDTLVVRGLNLRADEVTVRFLTGDVVLPPASVADDELSVPLPATLRAGPNTLQVVQSVALPGSSGTRRFFSSDVSAFVLAPRITTSIPPAGISVARGSDLTLGLAPPVAREQRVSVLIGETAIERRISATDPVTTSSVVFAIPPAPFPAGTSLLRMVVDGAETPLVVDTTSDSPTEGQYIRPKVIVT